MPLRFCQLFTTFYDLLFVISPYFCNLFPDESMGKPQSLTQTSARRFLKPKNAAASTQPSESQRPKNTQKYHIAEFVNLF
jgi:hypothetical protein